MGGALYIIIIGLIAGFLARLIMPGPNNPQGFLLTCALGILGAFLATAAGQQFGHYRMDQGAGIIAATLGAVVILFIWHFISGRRRI